MSTLSVVAIEENKTISDPAGDVFTSDFLGFGETEDIVYVSEHSDIDVKNIDIREITYIRQDKDVTLTLKVDGEIENRGNMEDIPNFGLEEIDINVVEYKIGLGTSNESYVISYVNEKCQLNYYYDDETVNLSEGEWYIDNKDTLVISFELKSNDETYEYLEVTTTFTKMNISIFTMDPEDLEDLEGFVVLLMDIAPNPPLEVFASTAHGTTIGTVGKNIQFNGSAYFGEGGPPYTYKWDFGDGETSTEKNPTHIYEKAGDYEYNLTVTDSSGAKESSYGEINIIAGEDNGTPGFELIIVIAAIGLFLLWKRR